MGKRWGKYGANIRVRLTPAQEAALREMAARDGITVAEAARRAIAAYVQPGEERTAIPS